MQALQYKSVSHSKKIRRKTVLFYPDARVHVIVISEIVYTVYLCRYCIFKRSERTVTRDFRIFLDIVG